MIHGADNTQKAKMEMVPLTDDDNNPTGPRSQVRCRVCGIPITHWLCEPDIRVINKVKNEKYEDGEPLVPQGIILDITHILEKNEYFWGAQNSEIIVNLNDLVNTRDGGVRHGCCGVDGSDGINLFCVNNHPIGTEVSDCYQPEFVHLPVECIVVESRAVGFKTIVPRDNQRDRQVQKKKHDEGSYSQFPDGFNTEKRIKIEAEFFRLALTCGLVGKKDVVGWADTLIEKGNDINVVLDLSLAAGKLPGEVTRLLGEFPGQCELAYPVKMLLAYSHSLVTNTMKRPEEILLALSDLVAVDRVPESVKHDIGWLEELRYMAQSDEFTTTYETGDEIVLYLAKYAKYRRLVPHVRASS